MYTFFKSVNQLCFACASTLLAAATCWQWWFQQSKKVHAGVLAATVSCMSMVWPYTGTLSCPVSPGMRTLHPTPYGGLIWGEGPCILLLVRNNHSRPITFTSCHALVTHSTLKREIIHVFSTITDNEESELESYKLFKVALMRLIPNRLKQIAAY